MYSLTPQRMGILLTILATLCWGGGMVLSKQSLGNVSVNVNAAVNVNNLFVVQLLSAWACIFVLTLAGGKLSLREIRHGWLGILEPGIAFYLVLVGLTRTSAINATILQSLEGLMIIGLSFVFFRGQVSSRTLWWGALSALGAVLVTSKESILHGITITTGDALVLLGTLFAALYVTLSSRLVGDKNRVESLLFWQLSVCTVLLIATLLLRGEFALQAEQFNVYAVSSGALVYGLSFYFYLVGMQTLPTHLSAILLCLTPIFGVVFSVLFLAESINAQNIVGFAMILLASVFVTRESVG